MLRSRSVDRIATFHSGSPTTSRPSIYATPAFTASAALEDPRRGIEVALLAERHHRGPARGRQRTRARSGEGRRVVQATGPRGGRVVLQMAELGRPVQDDRRALRGIAVLVGVAADRRHAGDPEVERWHRVAEPLGPRQQEATEAAVGVEADVPLRRRGRQLFDRVDQPGREAGRRTDERDRVVVDRRDHGVDIGPAVGGHRNLHAAPSPKYWHAFSKAAWALVGTTRLGWVTPLSRPRSR